MSADRREFHRRGFQKAPRVGWRRRTIPGIAAVFAALALWSPPGAAAERISAEQLSALVPGAARAGDFEGTPPAAPVFEGEQRLGYVFSTQDTVGTVGYSGKPIDILVAIDLEAVITGALLAHHKEPILVIGIPEERLRAYVRGFAGVDLKVALQGPVSDRDAGGDVVRMPDAISGATVSSAVIRDGILRAGRAVARSRGLLGGSAGGVRLDRESFSQASWSELLADGSIVQRTVTVGEVADRLEDDAAAAGPDPDAPFIDLYAALASPPRVGQTLLGKALFNRLTATMAPEDQLLFIAANGAYSFKGTEFVRSGTFDRIQIIQDDTSIRLLKDGYHNIETVQAAGAPEFREAGAFVVPAASGFDPLQPWRLDLAVKRGAPGDRQVAALFSLDYALPDRYRIGAPNAAEGAPEDAAGDAATAEERPLWQSYWFERWGDIVIVTAILAVLTAILVGQDALVDRYRLYRSVRLVFLTVTLVWIGWYANAQLSVVNVITFSQSLISDFRWEFFLLDPLIFILWSYVAVALLFWGRGVYCGWLCPFGALQELLSEGARALRVPQVRLPFIPHERLWPIKYVIFLGLFAVSLHSMELAFKGAEVEPFKTVILMKFMREWPFVLYAAALLIAGLFIERFFCRYLCPLGAALAIPARLRMFEWLKRHPQCGRECRICEQRCPVQAIHPSGAINPNECIYCLNCQQLYYDEWICPPLVARRKRRERRQALMGGGGQAVAE